MNSRLYGIRVIHELQSDDETLSEIIAELAYIPDIVVLTPWNAEEAKRPLLKRSQVIIAGGEPLANSPENVTGIALDRTQHYTRMGEIAGNMAIDQGKPALVLHNGDIDSLLTSYESITNGRYPILNFPVINDINNDTLPDGFIEEAAEASVLLLLAGTMNTKAYHGTQNIQPPVITESASSAGYWSKRIIASIENDDRRMRKILLTVMGNKNQDSLIFYPGRLKYRRKWFDSFKQSIL